MKIVAVIIQFIFFELLLCYGQCSAQCLSKKEFTCKIDDIENDTSEVNVKISRLNTLLNTYHRCYNQCDSIEARILHRSGAYFSQQKNIRQSIEYTNKAIQINKLQSGSRRFLPLSYLNISLDYIWLYKYHLAIHYLDSTIATSLQHQENFSCAYEAYLLKSYLQHQEGDYHQSITTLDQAKFFVHKMNDSEKLATLLYYQAQSYSQTNDTSAAFSRIKEADKLLMAKKKSPQDLSFTYSIKGNIYRNAGKVTEAIEHYQKSYKFNRLQKNWQQCFRDLINIGSLYVKSLHDAKKALWYYNEGQKLDKDSRFVYEQAVLYNHYCEAYIELKDFPKAIEYAQRALKILPIKFNESSYKRNPQVAELKMVADDYFVFQIFHNKARAIHGLSAVKDKEAHLKEALKVFLLADKFMDIIRWNQSQEFSQALSREIIKEMYEDAIQVCYELKDPESAFYFFEKSRAEILRDKISANAAHRYLKAEQLQFHRDLQSEISFLQQQLQTTKDKEENQLLLRKKIFDKQRELENYIKSLEKSNPSYYEAKYNHDIITLGDVQKELTGKNQTLVEFFIGEKNNYALVIDTIETRLVQLNYQKCKEDVKELLKYCSNKELLNHQFSKFRDLSFNLGDSLFKPLSIKTRRLIISPDGEIIPFETLLYSKSPDEYLFKKYSFSYIYSGTLLFKKVSRSVIKHPSFVGFAPVQYAEKLNQISLTGADESLHSIEKIFEDHQSFIREKANKRAFLDNFKNFTIMHLYSHAYSDSNQNDPTVFMHDSSVSVSELIKHTNGQTQLAVLTACNTGVGRKLKGEGVFSLARGFSQAGIPSVITSLWQIENNATFLLTKLFYQYIVKGIPLDIALQQAKVEFIDNSDKEKELPYFWASTILIGSSEPVIQFAIRETEFGYGYYMLGIAFILILLIGLVLNGRKTISKKV